jgi:hypothetical protein
MLGIGIDIILQSSRAARAARLRPSLFRIDGPMNRLVSVERWPNLGAERLSDANFSRASEKSWAPMASRTTTPRSEGGCHLANRTFGA